MSKDDSWWTGIETFLAARAIDELAESKITFATHCSFSSESIERCHSFDLRCFPYVTFYVGSENAQWNNTTFDAYEGVEFGKHAFYEIDASGSPEPSPFGASTSDGVGIVLAPCFITCPNVLAYQNKMIEWVELIMARGADGVFVDNLFTRAPCFGARLGIHPHTFPDPADVGDASAQNQAFAALLQRVREVVKRHRPDGRVLGNSGDPLNLPLEFQQYIDSDMIEGYVCLLGKRVTDWHGMTWDAAGRALQAYLARKKELLVISEIAICSPSQIAEDAFLCYASARLAGFMWTCNIATNGVNSLAVRNLFSLRLGEPLTEELTDGASGVNYRVFSRGLVAVNPDTVNDKVLTVQPPIVGRVFRDVFASESTSVLAVPKYSGRVFLFDGSVDFGQGVVTP
jgi:hypothetical protein